MESGGHVIQEGLADLAAVDAVLTVSRSLIAVTTAGVRRLRRGPASVRFPARRARGHPGRSCGPGSGPRDCGLARGGLFVMGAAGHRCPHLRAARRRHLPGQG